MTLALNFHGQSSNRLISGIGGLIDMEWKGYESIIHDPDYDHCLTVLRRVDVRDSDQGDFKQQPTIDISSLYSHSVSRKHILFIDSMITSSDIA